VDITESRLNASTAGRVPKAGAGTRGKDVVLRLSKVVMVVRLAAYALLITFGNITDYGSNFAFIQYVMSMDTTFPGNHLMYRTITSPILHNIAYCAIIAGESLTGIVLAVAAWPSSSGSLDSSSSAASGSPCGNPRHGMASNSASASLPVFCW
jgi:hypothetical protein